MAVSKDRPVELLKSRLGRANTLTKFRLEGMAGRKKGAQMFVFHAEMQPDLASFDQLNLHIWLWSQ